MKYYEQIYHGQVQEKLLLFKLAKLFKYLEYPCAYSFKPTGHIIDFVQPLPSARMMSNCFYKHFTITVLFIIIIIIKFIIV